MRRASALALVSVTMVAGASVAKADDYTQTFTGLSDQCQLFGAGRSDSGQLGGGNIGLDIPDLDIIDEWQQPTPVLFGATLLPGEAIASVSPVTTSYVLTTEGRVFGAGSNYFGQLGNGTQTLTSTPTLVQIPAGEEVVTITKGLEGQVVLFTTASGKVYIAGQDYYDQSGDGATSTAISIPVEFPLPAGEIAERAIMSFDALNVFVITTSGKLFASGANFHGQLGRGVTSALPAGQFPLPAGELAADVVASGGTTLVRTTSGKVFGAGLNASGQLGDGTTTSSSTPVQFQLPAGEVAHEPYLLVSYSGAVTSYVTTESGKMYGAGTNTYGQLGDGSTTNRSTPVAFPLPAGELVDEWYGATSMSTTATGSWEYAQSASVWVLTRSGKIFGSGDNQYGQLGNGTTTAALTPVQYQLPAGEVATAFGGAIDAFFGLPDGVNGTVTAALTASGKVYSAGYNREGQLGIGAPTGVGSTTPSATAEPTPTPFVLPTGETAVQIAVSGSGVSALTATGRVFGAGSNARGQLGDGTTIAAATPVEFIQPAGRRARGLFNRQFASIGYFADVPYPYSFVVSCPRLMSLGDRVFDDANDNGRQDPGELGLGGLTVRLYKDGAATPLHETTTGSGGSWLFTNLEAGNYVVELVIPAGFRSSTDAPTSGDPGNGAQDDDNGVTVNGATVRTNPIVLTTAGDAPTGEVNSVGDTTPDPDGNLTIRLGLHRPVVSPTPKQDGAPTPKADPVPTPKAAQPVGSPAPAAVSPTSTRLRITKRALRRVVSAGQGVGYQLVVTNVGPVTARGVRVCDQLPAPLTLAGTSVENARVRVSKGQACALIGELRPGARRTIAIKATVVRAAPTGAVINRATATAYNAPTVSAVARIQVRRVSSNASPDVTG